MKKIIFLIIVMLYFSGCMSMMLKQQQAMIDKQLPAMVEQQQETMTTLMGTVNEEDMALEVIDSTTLRTIFNVDSSIENSHSKIVEWVNNNFTDTEDLQPVYMPDSQSIKGTGQSLITIEMMNIRQPIMISFKYLFEIKEGRIRFSILEPYYYIVYVDEQGYEKTQPTKTYADEDTLRRISRGIKEKGIITDLIAHIEEKSITNDDW